LDPFRDAFAEPEGVDQLLIGHTMARVACTPLRSASLRTGVKDVLIRLANGPDRSEAGDADGSMSVLCIRQPYLL
jgi:hypothetical protein